MFVCHPICLCVCPSKITILFVHLLLFQVFSLSVQFGPSLSICLSFCMYVCMSIHFGPSLFPFVCLSVYKSSVTLTLVSCPQLAAFSLKLPVGKLRAQHLHTSSLTLMINLSYSRLLRNVFIHTLPVHSNRRSIRH